MTPRAWLVCWALAVVAATLVHEPAWLAAWLVAVLVASGQGRPALFWGALRVVAPVLLLVSTGYLAMGWWSDSLAWTYLLRLNLRVVLLAVLTAWVARDVDLERALQGWPAAQRWLSIVRGQATVFRRLAGEYRAAVQSRSTVPPSLGQRYRAGAALGLAALDKAVYNSEAVTQAMRSRGALDD